MQQLIVLMVFLVMFSNTSFAQTESVTSPMASPKNTAFNYSRAIKNYEDVKNGKVDTKNLSEEEIKELYIFTNSMLSTSVPEGASSECRDAWSAAENSANSEISNLDTLKRCLESGGLKDDCSSKFRQVKYSHEQYEAAVQKINSECN